MAEKRKNPYTRLLDEIKDWCNKVRYRHQVSMWFYPKDRLIEGWSLNDLYERTKAAEQLGYDVVVVANDKGLSVTYVKKVPEVPYRWR